MRSTLVVPVRGVTVATRRELEAYVALAVARLASGALGAVGLLLMAAVGGVGVAVLLVAALVFAASIVVAAVLGRRVAVRRGPAPGVVATTEETNRWTGSWYLPTAEVALDRPGLARRLRLARVVVGLAWVIAVALLLVAG